MEPHTSLPNLLCEENESSLKENKNGFPSVSVSQSDCEFIETLFECEASFQPDGDVNSVWTERCWFGSVRSDVIKWILEVCRFPFSLLFIFFPISNIYEKYEILLCVCARAQKRALFGYHYRTAYLSLIYFDRFLTKKWISVSMPTILNLVLPLNMQFEIFVVKEE